MTKNSVVLGNIIDGKSVNETMLKAFRSLIDNGTRVESRNGAATSLYNTLLMVEDPRNRTLCLHGRSSNVYQLIAETLWVMSGSDVVDGFLEFFLPRAKQYSDDGNTWSGAYGPRIYAHDQLKDVISAFQDEGIFTRRAVISIADPNQDSRAAFEERFPDLPLGSKQKDVPCNREIHFFVTQAEDEAPRFNMKVIQRSGDAIFGAGSINPFEFTVLQEIVYNWVKTSGAEGAENLKLGSYVWDVTNFHLYDFTAKQAHAILEQPQPHVGMIQTSFYITPPQLEESQQFFGDIVTHLSSILTLDSADQNLELDEASLLGIFNTHGVPTRYNLLWSYVRLTLFYIYGKRGFKVPQITMDDLEVSCSTDLRLAIINSSFTPFSIKV